jgi:hypothetical protein
MAHFDSILATVPGSQSHRRGQFSSIIRLLALGAPVQQAHIKFDSAQTVFSAVAAYEVNDGGGAPSDSNYILVGWSGPDGDSLVDLNVSEQTNGLVLTTPSRLLGSMLSTGSATAGARGATCASYASQIPADVTLPTGVSCHAQTTFASDAGFLSGDVISDVKYRMALQEVRGIRIDGEFGMTHVLSAGMTAPSPSRER